LINLKASLNKSERLKRRNLLEAVFKKGKAKTFHPFRVIYFAHDEPISCPLQVCVSVPKRKFAKATDRNRIKRQIREIYRVRKNPLLVKLTDGEQQISLVLIFIAKEGQDFPYMERKMDLAIKWLHEQLDHSTGKAS